MDKNGSVSQLDDYGLDVAKRMSMGWMLQKE